MHRITKHGLLAISFLSILGCANKSNTDKEYIEYEKSIAAVGSDKNYTKKITLTDNKDQIDFYVDQFPFERKFNLCDAKKFANKLKSNLKDATYMESEFDTCLSYIYIDEIKGIEGNYRINLNYRVLASITYDKKNNALLGQYKNGAYGGNLIFNKSHSQKIDSDKKFTIED